MCCTQLRKKKKLHLQPFKLQNFLSFLPADDMDSLQVEVSGLLKELHCPSEELVSGILKGRLLKAKDHLKCLCMSSLLKSRCFSFSLFLAHINSDFASSIQCSSAPSSRRRRLPNADVSQTHRTGVLAARSSWRCAPH